MSPSPTDSYRARMKALASSKVMPYFFAYSEGIPVFQTMSPYRASTRVPSRSKEMTFFITALYQIPVPFSPGRPAFRKTLH